ncbi:hypothetical protein PR202_gb03469 [Eleusine coracana subsp. coracana]|uniref:Cinnamyl alcohol dehydrogenase n=1 Tax=Eleusine coracana subsp. coracana TaxID=191504 RepID=A0AAV5E181_ELECO|nr:hypothetical protein PR202_gb03469 [Eleusine coracana subsp. coracana]
MNQPGKSLGVIGLGGLGHMAVKFGKAFGLKSLKSSQHFIIDATSGEHPFDPYLSLLEVGGVMALLSFPSEIKVHPANLNLGARSLSGSVTGGTKDTQNVINFCAENNIYPEIEMIKMDYINEALERLINKDVRYRFVVDIEKSFK